MRILRSVVVITALASGAISFAPPVQAAVLTIGQAGHQAKGPYGRFVCAEVSAGSLSPGTPIQAWSCHGGPNQQFEFNSLAIYALGGQGCVDVSDGRTTAGTPVQFWPCNGTGAQQWYYQKGKIYNPQSNKCLDALDMANGRQLVINYCDSAISENWQIK